MKVLHKLNSLLAGSAVVAVAAFAGAGLAQADGYQSKGKVVYEAPWNWSGFYFGIHSGYAWSDSDASYATVTGAPVALAGVFGYGTTHNTPIVGGQIGLQQQFGQLVVGAEIDLSSAFRDAPNASYCSGGVAALGATSGVLCTNRFDDVFTAGARLGWAMGKYLPYVTGGYASAGFEHRGVDVVTGNPVLRSRDREDGWYFGGGLDYAIAKDWVLGVEYRHYELDDVFSIPSTIATGLGTGSGSPSATGTPFLAGSRFIDSSLDTVTLRVSWKWGRPEPAPMK